MGKANRSKSFVTGFIPTCAGFIPVASTDVTGREMLGHWRVRWGMGRMDFKVNPGLYAIGSPGQSSPVFVTANYKLSFDSVRKSLHGLDSWLIVLDTNGVNVWCAAGKGTFGTDEVVRRIRQARLSSLVSHRKVILPQLGATGVAAHDVRRETGFTVVYGPVRASDIPQFMARGMKADDGMRTVTFSLRERLAVVPVELVQSWKMLLPAVALLIVLALIRGRMSPGPLAGALAVCIAAVLTGTVAVPVLLPFIPGRSFIFKGWLAGLAVAVLAAVVLKGGWMAAASLVFLVPAVSAYLALNFTGATPWTSLSGVRKEMRLGLPLIIASAALGCIFGIAELWRVA